MHGPYTLEEIASHAPPEPRQEPVWSAPQTYVSDRERIIERARAYLSAVPPAVQGQQGDSLTFRKACSVVRGFDLNESEALWLLGEWNARCQPPWTERELIQKIQGARKYGKEPIGGLAGMESRSKWDRFRAVRPVDMVFPQDEHGEQEIVTVDSLNEDIDRLYTSGFDRGLNPGWRSLSELYRVRKREITVVTGWPGHGKSSVVDNIVVHMAKAHDWKWAIFSAENLPIQRHIGALAEIYTGKPFSPGPTPRMTLDELGVAKKFLHEHIRFIRPLEHRQSVARILELSGDMLEKHSIDAVILDPWNELDHGRPSNMREDEYISVALSMIRWFTRNHDLHFFVVAHPRLLGRENGKFPVPTLRDIKGASEWEAKADNGLCVWRDKSEENLKTYIYVQKIRFREVGQTGMCELNYDKATGRFLDPLPSIDDYMRRRREPGEDDE